MDRHNTIEKFLKSIGIRESLLIETELIEHNVSRNTLKNIDGINEFLVLHPEVVREFEEFKTAGNSGKNPLVSK